MEVAGAACCTGYNHPRPAGHGSDGQDTRKPLLEIPTGTGGWVDRAGWRLKSTHAQLMHEPPGFIQSSQQQTALSAHIKVDEDHQGGGAACPAGRPRAHSLCCSLLGVHRGLHEGTTAFSFPPPRPKCFYRHENHTCPGPRTQTLAFESPFK